MSLYFLKPYNRVHVTVTFSQIAQNLEKIDPEKNARRINPVSDLELVYGSFEIVRKKQEAICQPTFHVCTVIEKKSSISLDLSSF